MISLEQISALETRVEKAVSLINSLRSENKLMKEENEALKLVAQSEKERASKLEAVIDELQFNQEKIEKGIVETLKKLDAFEDKVHTTLVNNVKHIETVAEEKSPSNASIFDSQVEEKVSEKVEDSTNNVLFNQADIIPENESNSLANEQEANNEEDNSSSNNIDIF